MATKPTHNLIRDGIDKCADYVLVAIRRKTTQVCLYIDRNGWIRVRTAKDYTRGEIHDRPDSEFVCSYRRSTACVEYIREDLQDRLDSMPKFLRQEAA